MSDSLRDQLLQAGFNAPKEPERRKRPTGKKPGRGKNPGGKAAAGQQTGRAASTQRGKTDADGEAEARIARRKAIKAEIKTLIEAAAIKEFQGESVYRFILNKRIRELHVKEDIRLQLIAGTLVITRLNGTTWLVPETTAEAIRKLNPDWAVVTPAPDSSEDTSGYEDFTVPDDLQW
ncbi:DUF2058 domain-containing protein [Granulosicoccus sp. 3-233]|uniref:DUF2058 domain-containing protein n=1 Tax=Granulosicoccus sp. 3-233 TaxID=3417969 RepID=UPI003D34A198